MHRSTAATEPGPRSAPTRRHRGSWNRAPEQQAGYRVIYQPLRSGATNGDFTTIADGFAGLPADQVQPDRAKHRPVGIAAMPDGSLLVTDDAGGRVYRLVMR